MIPIVLYISIFIEILPVQKSSDLTSLIICGFTLCAYFSVAFCITFLMEDLDSRLFITGVEISCWQDQLTQAVSVYFSPISILNN